MTSAREAPEPAATPWIGTAAIAVLLLTGGLVRGYTGILDSPPYRGPDRTLIADGAWPYLLALTLGLIGSVAAAALYRRDPEWLAPAALTLTAVPAFALTTELSDPPEYYRPYVDAVGEVAGTGPGPTYLALDIEVGPGSWITFFTLMGLAVAAVIWLGRTLHFLTDRRWAAGVLVLILLAGAAGYALADAYADDATCDTSPVDSSEVSPDWAFWLVAYLPGVLAGIGLGAMTRRRFASGSLLLVGALAALGGLALIGFQLATPCLD